MSPVDAARVAPLSWPPTLDVDARWLARVMHALAVELDACWRAHELVRSLGDELGSRPVADLLEQAAYAGVVVADSSAVIDLLATHAPEAAAHLHAAGERRRRALGVLRDQAWLARRGLLDRLGLRSELGQVLADLASAGRSIAAADRTLLSGVWLPESAQRRE